MQVQCSIEHFHEISQQITDSPLLDDEQYKEFQIVSDNLPKRSVEHLMANELDELVSGYREVDQAAQKFLSECDKIGHSNALSRRITALQPTLTFPRKYCKKQFDEYKRHLKKISTFADQLIKLIAWQARFDKNDIKAGTLYLFSEEKRKITYKLNQISDTTSKRLLMCSLGIFKALDTSYKDQLDTLVTGVVLASKTPDLTTQMRLGLLEFFTRTSSNIALIFRDYPDSLESLYYTKKLVDSGISVSLGGKRNSTEVVYQRIDDWIN